MSNNYSKSDNLLDNRVELKISHHSDERCNLQYVTISSMLHDSLTMQSSQARRL